MKPISPKANLEGARGGRRLGKGKSGRQLPANRRSKPLRWMTLLSNAETSLFLEPNRIQEFLHCFLDLLLVREMLQKYVGGTLVDSGSPLKFAPRECLEFFAPYGWRPVETQSLLHTAVKLKRLSIGMRSYSPIQLVARPTSRGEESACWRTANPASTNLFS
jgi:hypothetical protein